MPNLIRPCPECGGINKVNPDAEKVTCAYCGKEFAVRGKTKKAQSETWSVDDILKEFGLEDDFDWGTDGTLISNHPDSDVDTLIRELRGAGYSVNWDEGYGTGILYVKEAGSKKSSRGYRVATTQQKVAMVLLTQEILGKVPPLYSQDGKGMDALVYAKFFTPDSNWTWFMTEYDPVNREAFGYVQGHEGEMGYFSMDELETVTGPMGLRIERDFSFPIGSMTLGKAIETIKSGAHSKASRPTLTMLASRPRKRAFRFREAGLIEDIVGRVKAWLFPALGDLEQATRELSKVVGDLEKTDSAPRAAQVEAPSEVSEAYREYTRLKSEVRSAEARLDELKPYLIEEFKKFDEQTALIDGFLVKATIYKQSWPKYKAAFETALTKVNGAIRNILEGVLAENVTEGEVLRFN